MRVVHPSIKVITFNENIANKIDGLNWRVFKLEVKRDYDGKPYISMNNLDHKRAIWKAIKEKFPNVTVDQIKANFSLTPYVYDDEVE